MVVVSDRTAVAVVIGAVSAVVFMGCLGRRKREKQEEDKQGRRWSYTSVGIARGTFPKFVEFPEPIIHGAIFFRDCPSKEEVVSGVVTKVVEYERFATVPDWKAETGKPIENLDVSRLVRHVTIDCDQSGVFDVLEQLLHEPLVDGRVDLPWWEFVIYENKGSGESVIVWRIHHALADGLSVLTLVEQFVTFKDGRPLADVVPESMLRPPKLEIPWYKLWWQTIVGIGKVIALPNIGRDDNTVFAKGLFKGMKHNRNRKIVVFEPIPVSFVKELKEASGISFNSILYTCICNAIQSYLEIKSCPVYGAKGKKTKSRTLMAVALPRPEEVSRDKSRAMCNQWCLVSLGMALGCDNVLAQGRALHESTKRILSSPLVKLQMGAQNVVGKYLPFSLLRKNVYDGFWRHSLVYSSVPGPNEACLFAGKEVTQVQLLFTNLAPQVGLVSYGGNVYGSVTLDPDAIPDYELIPPLISGAFVRLSECLGLSCPEALVAHAQQVNEMPPQS